MNKIKIERSVKLRDEDQRGRKFNILTGANDKEEWKGSYGDQVQLINRSPAPPSTNDMKDHWKNALA